MAVDAYRNALARSIYSEDVEELERQKRMRQTGALTQQIIKQALASEAPSAVAGAASVGGAAGSTASTSAATTASTSGATAASSTAPAAQGISQAASSTSSTSFNPWGLAIGGTVAIRSATPDSPLFKVKKPFYNYYIAPTDKYVHGGWWMDPVFKSASPTGVLNSIFGDPNVQEEEYKRRQARLGLLKAMNAVSGNQGRVRSNSTQAYTPYDPDNE